MSLRDSFRKWFLSPSRAIGNPHKNAGKRAKLLVEYLEERVVPTRTLFIDTGDFFPTGGLNTTVLQLRDTFANGGLQGPNFNGGTYTDTTNLNFSSLQSVVNFDYNGDGSTNALDYTQLKANVLSVVQRIYAPFDVNVQFAPQENNTSSATYRAGIIATLQAADTGSAWAFCSTATDVDSATLIGGDKNESGQAPLPDINNATNNQTNTVAVFADYMLQPGFFFNSIQPRGANADTALGDNISHESGHSFSLQHIYNTTAPRTVALANSEVMGYGLSWTQYGYFTRYPLLADYVLGSSPSVSPGPALIDYDRLAAASQLGVRPNSPAYVTGTGGFDTINITASGANTAQISIATFSDAAHTAPLNVPGGNATYVGNDGPTPTIYTANGNVFTYTVNTANGIVLDTGEGTDWVVVDANIATNVTIRGNIGANRVEIQGNGATNGFYEGNSAPVPTLVTQDPTGAAVATDLGGFISVGSTTVTFQDDTTASQVYVHDVTNFTYETPNSADTLTLDSPQAGRQRISGTSSGVGLVPLVFSNVANLGIDTGTNDFGGSGDDSVTLAGNALATGLQSISLNTGAGNDTVTVDDTNVFYNLAGGIRYDGGTGFNKLILTQTGGTAQTTDTYSVGPNPGEGNDVIVGAGGTQTVSFQHLAPVQDNVPATTATVNGTNADNAINYTQGPGGGIFTGNTGFVTVDNQESYEFNNKTNLVINGLAGSDTINMNNPTLPAGMTAGTSNITVNGGDPTGTGPGADTLIINRDGVTPLLDPTALGAGTVSAPGLPNAPFTGIESLQIVADGIDSFNIDGTALDDQFVFTQGLTPETGMLTGVMRSGGAQFPLVPITFLNAQRVVPIVINGGNQVGGNDSFVFNTTTSHDNVALTNGGGSTITLTDTVNGVLCTTLSLANMAGVNVVGNGGSDTFNHDGSITIPVSYSGSPAGNDVLTFRNAASIVVSLDLGAQTVTEGAGTVSFNGLAAVTVNANGAGVLVNGSGGPDILTYTPTGATSASLTSASLATVFNFTGVSGLVNGFSINGNGGSDKLIVDGTQNADTIDVNDAASGGSAVKVNSLLVVTYLAVANVEVDALAGSDTINVTPSAATSFTVDGGDPIGVLPGDVLNLIHPAAIPYTIFPGPTKDSGGMSTPAFQTVSWIHIETVVNTGGGPAIIQGTNFNDEITVIARDSSYNPGNPGVPNPLLDGVQDFTVSVNDGAELLFINQPFLFLDAKAGNDDIVVQEPAPNNAIWNVQVYVAGGTPSTGTGRLGDIVSLETPGTESVTYSPDPAAIPAVAGFTFPASPNPVDTAILADTTNTSSIIGTQFLFPGFYQSSPGGVESMVYQGDGGNDTLTYNAPANGGKGNSITYVPGATADAGAIQARLAVSGTTLVPFSFMGLGDTGGLAFTNVGGRVDDLTVDGTANSDRFQVTGTAAAGAGTVQIFKSPLGTIESVVMSTASLSSLDLHGLAGSDVYNLTAPLPYTQTIVDGGDPITTLTGATGPVTVHLADLSLNTNTTITGYGGTVTLVGVDTANLDANGNSLTATGTTQDDNIVYTPTGAAAGTFYDNIGSGNNAVPNTVFNITNVTGNFLVFNDPGGNSDQVTLRATAARDLIEINQGSGVAQVLANNVTALLPVQLGISVEILNAQGLGGQDTFQVIPAPGIAGQAQDNLLINLDGGSAGEFNALVIGGSFGAAPATLGANVFVVVNKSLTADAGTVRVFTNAVPNPDINYTFVQTVQPLVTGTSLNPNLLVMGADGYEPNDQQGNAAFLARARRCKCSTRPSSPTPSSPALRPTTTSTASWPRRPARSTSRFISAPSARPSCRRAVSSTCSFLTSLAMSSPRPRAFSAPTPAPAMPASVSPPLPVRAISSASSAPPRASSTAMT